MASTTWEDIKKKVKGGVTVAAEKTEEYAKIGKLKVDIVKINLDLDKAYANLGREMHKLLTKSKKIDVTSNTQVKTAMAKIDDLNKKVQAKKKKIESIKKETTSKSKKDVTTTAAQKPKSTTTTSKKTVSKKTKKS